MTTRASKGAEPSVMSADNAAQREGAARESLLARYPLTFYFIIAYTFAWLVWVPLALSKEGAGVLSYRSPIGASASIAIASFGPFFLAFIMTGIIEGREGIGRLLRRCVLWRVELRWYLFTLIGLPMILVLGVIVLPGAMASFKGFASLVASLPGLILIVYVLFHGPVGEEPGWRGFALPRLQRLYGPLVGSLILGPLWALWHLPLFWVPAWNFPPTLVNIGMFVIASIPFTIIMTWVFNNTKGSVLIAILLHGTFDMTFVILNQLFTAPIVTDYGSTVPILIGCGAAALLMIALTRGRLGYKHYRQGESDLATVSR